MPNIFLVSDPHFSHSLMVKGFRDDGITKNRPWDSIEEHDEAIIDNWNSVVSPEDKVYVLGDVSMPRRGIAQIGRCNGKKRLIKGNHDIYPLKDYVPYFTDIRASHKLEGVGVLSHIPIHPLELDRFKMNVHGHLHEHVIPDVRYFNVCMEQIGYTPIELSELIVRMMDFDRLSEVKDMNRYK